MTKEQNKLNQTWKGKLHEIIFEADTPAGKIFDVVLLWSILASVIVVMMESVDSLKSEYGTYFTYIEWTFTILFSMEYFARILTIKKPLNYVLSFYGIVDLLSILPTFLGIFIIFIGTRRQSECATNDPAVISFKVNFFGNISFLSLYKLGHTN